MIQVNNIISPLPFYSDISMQQHRKDYAYGAVYPLITERDMLLPFQFNIPFGTTISNVTLYRFDSNTTYDITASLKEKGLALKIYSNFTNISYPGKTNIPQISQEGRYYLSMTVSGTTYYSDVFTRVDNTNEYILLEYRNSQNLELFDGVVDFTNGFSFICYLCSQVGKPEYVFEEEATERMGYTFIESQVSKKLFKFTFIAPEYLCDALRIVRLCDFKTIKTRDVNYKMTTFAIEPKWEDQGDLAAVEAEFETDTVIATLGGYKEIGTIPVDYVTLNKNNLELVKNLSETLIAYVSPSNATNKNVRWVSSDTSVATVNNLGVVNAVGEGSAYITVITEYGNKTDSCSVSVTEASYITPDFNSDSFESVGGTKRMGIKSNVDWSVEMKPDWLNATKIGNELVYTCSENTFVEERIGTIVLSGGGVEATIIITQTGTSVSELTVSPTSYNFVQEGSDMTFSITSNGVWYVDRNNTMPSWLSANLVIGAGDGSFTLTAEGNTSTSIRSATIPVSIEGKTVNITITQDAYVAPSGRYYDNSYNNDFNIRV